MGRYVAMSVSLNASPKLREFQLLNVLQQTYKSTEICLSNLILVCIGPV